MTAQQQHWYKNEKYLWVWFSTSLLLKLSAVTVGQGWQVFFQISITSGYFWHTADFAFNCILHAPFQQSQHMILAYLFQCSFKYRFDIFYSLYWKLFLICSSSKHRETLSFKCFFLLMRHLLRFLMRKVILGDM